MIEFGQKIAFSRVLSRKIEYRKKPLGNDQRYKLWAEIDQHGEGIYLGERVLRNGITTWDDEYGYKFISCESFKAAIICPGPQKNTIYVPLDKILEMKR